MEREQRALENGSSRPEQPTGAIELFVQKTSEARAAALNRILDITDHIRPIMDTGYTPKSPARHLYNLQERFVTLLREGTISPLGNVTLEDEKASNRLGELIVRVLNNHDLTIDDLDVTMHYMLGGDMGGRDKKKNQRIIRKVLGDGYEDYDKFLNTRRLKEVLSGKGDVDSTDEIFVLLCAQTLLGLRVQRAWQQQASEGLHEAIGSAERKFSSIKPGEQRAIRLLEEPAPKNRLEKLGTVPGVATLARRFGWGRLIAGTNLQRYAETSARMGELAHMRDSGLFTDPETNETRELTARELAGINREIAALTRPDGNAYLAIQEGKAASQLASASSRSTQNTMEQHKSSAENRIGSAGALSEHLLERSDGFQRLLTLVVEGQRAVLQNAIARDSAAFNRLVDNVIDDLNGIQPTYIEDGIFTQIGQSSP